jgi:hypothetical protein
VTKSVSPVTVSIMRSCESVARFDVLNPFSAAALRSVVQRL